MKSDLRARRRGRRRCRRQCGSSDSGGRDASDTAGASGHAQPVEACQSAEADRECSGQSVVAQAPAVQAIRTLVQSKPAPVRGARAHRAGARMRRFKSQRSRQSSAGGGSWVRRPLGLKKAPPRFHTTQVYAQPCQVREVSEGFRQPADEAVMDQRAGRRDASGARQTRDTAQTQSAAVLPYIAATRPEASQVTPVNTPGEQMSAAVPAAA